MDNPLRTNVLGLNTGGSIWNLFFPNKSNQAQAYPLGLSFDTTFSNFPKYIWILLEITWKRILGKTVIVVPDAHCRPGVPNDRFVRLGRLITEVKPTHVINLGDWGNLDSFSLFDFGKTRFKFCGKSYQADLDSVKDSMERLESTIRKTRWGKQNWGGVKKVVTGGNHDFARIERFLDYNGQFEGMISTKDWEFEGFGWRTYPYQERIEIDGIVYSHNFCYQMSNRPISGIHVAHQLLSKWHSSMTAGHSHMWNHAEHTVSGGKKIQGLVAGCFLEKDAKGNWLQEEEYSGESQQLWWSGVVVKRNVEKGHYDLQRISMESLVKEYPEV